MKSLLFIFIALLILGIGSVCSASVDMDRSFSIPLSIQGHTVPSVNLGDVQVPINSPLGGINKKSMKSSQNLSITPQIEELSEEGGSASASLKYLSSVMDQYHKKFDVYTDADAAGNHFIYKAKMNSNGGESYVPSMNERWSIKPHSGLTCIRASFNVGSNNWGGWYFQNGVLTGKMVSPSKNWGTVPNAGVNLKGASKLTFYAKGEKGGETVEFFLAGCGVGDPTKKYPDSSARVSTNPIKTTLTKEWKKYTIDCSKANLGYVLGGFGWVASASSNKNKAIVFYLDDISYEKSYLSSPRFLVSYNVVKSSIDFDTIQRNPAYVYDNSLAILAYLSRGNTDDIRRAKIIADALVYAQKHDRFYQDGRLRNAYQGGDLIVPPGWKPNGYVGTARMPGWYNQNTQSWTEDKYQVSTDTGNMAWAMLGLIGVYNKTHEKKYLNSAVILGGWVENHCKNGNALGGFTAGYQGWEPKPIKLTERSTEHNIDLYAAYMRLYQITGNIRWKTDAEHAAKFAKKMLNGSDGFFYTGTKDNGKNINKKVIPIDCQTWSGLSLLDLTMAQKKKALAFAEKRMRYGEGYAFAYSPTQNLVNGVWYEGTGQMGLAYKMAKIPGNWTRINSYLTRTAVNGAINATNKPLYTGFDNADQKKWYYYPRLHVGATAWKVICNNGYNPFWNSK